MNTKLVLDAVRAVGTTSQADLIRATSLSTGTIVSIVRGLSELGLLAQTGQGASRGGRRPTLLRLNPEAAFVLSCRVGSDAATAGVLDLGASILSRRELPIRRESKPGTLVADLAASLEDQVHELGICQQRIAGLGLSLHGPVDAERGVMLFSEHLGWRDVPFRDELARALDLPVFAEAETRAIALAEQRWGAARDAQDFVLIELDTGIGMVQVLDGRLCRGSHSLAGELGFTVWDTAEHGQGRQRPRILEDMASMQVLCRRAERLPEVASIAPQSFRAESSEELWLRWLVAASRAGEPRARQLLDETTHAVGLAVANVVNLLDPELVLLTGRMVSGTGGSLLDPIRAHVQAHLVGAPDRMVRIEPTVLGPDAAVLGAARLAIDHFFSVESLARARLAD